MDHEFIRWRDLGAVVRRSTLPGVLAALAGGAVDSFPSLRPHQREPWHAFCVQIAVLATRWARKHTIPEHEEEWRERLLGLTPEWPAGEAWSLIVDDWAKPALLQPPLVSPHNRADYRNVLHTPDELDILLTSKNHDFKRSRMYNAASEDWLFALVTLQTSEGFQGAGNYGISRMNGGFGTRMSFSLRATASASAGFRMDVERLLGQSDQSQCDPRLLPLLWVEPWDGTNSLGFERLDRLYIEICRRVRLVGGRTSAIAMTATSKVARIAAAGLKGRTGDPWSPIKADSTASITPSSAGFSYRQLARLLDRTQTNTPVLAEIHGATNIYGAVAIQAAALVRGQGKTEGLHRRLVDIPDFLTAEMAGKDIFHLIGDAASARASYADSVRVALQRSLQSLFQGGPEQVRFDDEASLKKAQQWLSRFDSLVDSTFFNNEFWREVLREQRGGLDTWMREMNDVAMLVLDETARLAPRRAMSRMRARAVSENYLDQQLTTLIDEQVHV